MHTAWYIKSAKATTYGPYTDSIRPDNIKGTTDSGGGENTGGSSPYTNYIGSGQNYWQPWFYVYMWKRLS